MTPTIALYTLLSGILASLLTYMGVRLTSRTTKEVARAANEVSETVSLRQTMLLFEERLRTRDAEFIVMQARITAAEHRAQIAEDKALIAERLAKEKADGHAECERNIALLQVEYQQIKEQLAVLMAS